MKRIVEVLHSLSGGGIESLLYSYFQIMDRADLQIDFIVYGDERGVLEPKFEAMGCNIFRVPHRHDGLKAHIKKLDALLAQGHYDIVHSHQSEKSFLTLAIAKKHGVKTRILHVHNAFPPESAKQRLARRLGAWLGKHYATDWFACSSDAGRWLYGDKAVDSGKVRVMPNAIDLDKFAFDESAREAIRKELKLDGHFVIGCAARFTHQKNHALLLDIFARVLESRKDALLLLAGDGELMESTRQKAKALGIENSVRFLGVRTDVPKLMQGMDAFVLPSRFEGLGIVFLEAQAAGLPTFGPNIPGARDTVVSHLMTAVSPQAAPEEWAKAILAKADRSPREGAKAELTQAGYDVHTQAKALEEFYRRA